MANLASLGALQTYIEPADQEDSETLQKLSTWASNLIRSYCQRPFTIPSVVEQRSHEFVGTRSRRFMDKLTEITEIVAPVTFYVEGEPYPYTQVLDPSQYRLEQWPTHTTLRFDSPADGIFQITGRWGWDEVPSDLEYACVITVDEWYRSNVISGYSDTQGGPEGRNLYLPREVQEALGAWRSVEVIA